MIQQFLISELFLENQRRIILLKSALLSLENYNNLYVYTSSGTALLIFIQLKENQKSSFLSRVSNPVLFDYYT